MRYASLARLILDDDEKIVGVRGDAFRLRESETYLSATWAEFHKQPSHQDNVRASVHTIRKSMKVGKNSAYAVGKVSAIDQASKAAGKKVRFVHEPEQNNSAHVALRGWPSDDLELFEHLAMHEWSTLVLNSQVP